MKTRPRDRDRLVPEADLWEAPDRLTDLDLAIHWGVERRWAPRDDMEEDR